LKIKKLKMKEEKVIEYKGEKFIINIRNIKSIFIKHRFSHHPYIRYEM
jgi:hypothetical protein